MCSLSTMCVQTETWRESHWALAPAWAATALGREQKPALAIENSPRRHVSKKWCGEAEAGAGDVEARDEWYARLTNTRKIIITRFSGSRLDLVPGTGTGTGYRPIQMIFRGADSFSSAVHSTVPGLAEQVGTGRVPCEACRCTWPVRFL